MKNSALTLITTLLATLILLLLMPGTSDAVPGFSRQLGQSCQLCHYAVPKLNPFGIAFKYYGYRTTPDEGVDIWESGSIPVSFIAEVEGVWNGGDLPDKTDLKIDEVELMFATAIHERLSAFAELEYKPGDEEWEVVARAQIDLTGKGNLNLALGDVEIDFPFLAHSRRIVRQSYLAEKIGFLPTKTAIEINGLTSSDGTVSTYMYNAGIARDADVNDDNKLASFYGTLTLGIRQHYLGLHYRFAEEDQAGVDEDVQRFAVTPELNFGRLSLVPGYFRADYDNYGGATEDLKANDFMGEALYRLSDDKTVLGLRLDLLDVEQGSADGDTTAIIVNATHYLRPNFYVAAEYRNLEHDNPDGVDFIGTDNVTEEKIRVFLFAMF